MRKYFGWMMRGAVAAAVVLLVQGCGSQPPVEEDVTQVEPPVEAPPVEEVPPPREEKPDWADPSEYAHLFKNINFDFNKYRILEKDKPTLEDIAVVLKDNPRWRVLIEGHCDERGTNEYNMGLGEQRALSAKRYLVSLGVSDGRFTTISYGEERPLASGPGEESWARNRRCQFRVEAPGS